MILIISMTFNWDFVVIWLKISTLKRGWYLSIFLSVQKYQFEPQSKCTNQWEIKLLTGTNDGKHGSPRNIRFFYFVDQLAAIFLDFVLKHLKYTNSQNF